MKRQGRLASLNYREPFTTEDIGIMYRVFCSEMDLGEVEDGDMGPGSALSFIRWLEVKRDKGMKHKVEKHEMF